MRSVVACLNPSHDYYVCFDELDRGFDPRDARYSQMLIGLILAGREITQAARKEARRLSVVIFLRDDIYQTLRFEDKNKISENFTSRIEWDSPRTRWTLRQLMEKRFEEVLGKGDWDAMFDETQEMPSRQSKYQHILDPTFRRPRDIIKFCNEALVAYKSRGGDGGGMFRNEDLIAARPSYSEYLLNELDDEIHKYIPHYEDYLELVKSLGSLQFNLEEWNDVCARRPDLLPETATPLSVLRELFEFSVIGYQRTGGVGGGSEYLWRYLDSRVRFDEAATNFRVHPGFMEAFGLKKFRRTRGS